MNATRTIASMTLAALLPCVCFADGLGPAEGFTIFTIQSHQSSNTDCTGRVAVGGPATYNNVGIGSALNDSNGTRDDLIVAGSLTWNNGYSFNGNVQGSGSTTLLNVEVPNGTVGTTVDIDFDEAELELQALSDYLFALPPNGLTVNQNGYLSLSGTNSNINVFSVSESALNPLWGLEINVPSGSTVLVNISSNAVQFYDFVPSLSGCSASKMLFNLPSTSSLELNSINWKGTILAPNANIQFNNGAIDGALISRTIQGDGESHHIPFEGNLPHDDDCDCCCHDDDDGGDHDSDGDDDDDHDGDGDNDDDDHDGDGDDDDDDHDGDGDDDDDDHDGDDDDGKECEDDSDGDGDDSDGDDEDGDGDDSDSDEDDDDYDDDDDDDDDDDHDDDECECDCDCNLPAKKDLYD